MATLPPVLADLSDRLLPVADCRASALPGAEIASVRAAVLVLLFPRGDAFRFPLTVRPTTLARHAGQIALPGGLVEAHDRSLWHAAVRETEEELGIDPAPIRPLGRLATHHLTVSDYLISPFVGWTETEPALVPDPAEVAEVFDVDLAELLDPALIAREEWVLRGSRWLVTFYRFEDHVVWGATARILHELACRLEGRSPHLHDGPGAVLPAE